MSLEASLATKLLNQNSENFLNLQLDNVTQRLEKIADVAPLPFLFIKSFNDNLSSNFSDGVIILKGIPVKPRHRATVKDFNLNFTTVAGTVRVVILDENDQEVIDVLRDINSNTNGIGETVLEEGQKLAVVGQTAGAGVFSIYCSGNTQQVAFD